jgi:uncharacterized RDD family membrane protein YckC
MIYQTFWSRVAAVLLDSLLLWPLILIGNTDEPGTWSIVTLTVMVLQHGYYVIGHAQYGQTLGKRLMGVRVVRAHEHLPLHWKHAIMRELLWIVLTITYSLSYFNKPDPRVLVPGAILVIADCLIALIHPRNRSLRDFIAKTVVVRVPLKS